MKSRESLLEDLQAIENVLDQHGLGVSRYEVLIGEGTKVRGRTPLHLEDRMPEGYSVAETETEIFLEYNNGESLDRLVYRPGSRPEFDYILLGNSDREKIEEIIDELEA